MAGRLGIVAGAGRLPRLLIEACRATGRDFFVLALEGAAEAETVRGVAHAWCRIGAAANGLSLLHENNVTEVVLAGGVRRPSLVSLRPDWRLLSSSRALATARSAMTVCFRRSSKNLREKDSACLVPISFWVRSRYRRARLAKSARIRNPKRISRKDCASFERSAPSISVRPWSFSK